MDAVAARRVSYNGAGMPGTAIEPFLDETCEPHVRGFLDRPMSPNGDALVLTHGAGANCQSLLLVAVASAAEGWQKSH